jgi:hypothetical protein
VVIQKTQNQYVPGDYTSSDKFGQPLILHFGFESSVDRIRMKLGKGKGKVHPRTGHEGPEEEQIYSSTIPSTSALDRGGWSTQCPGRFTPRERTGTHCIGGWVGPRAGLVGC